MCVLVKTKITYKFSLTIFVFLFLGAELDGGRAQRDVALDADGACTDGDDCTDGALDVCVVVKLRAALDDSKLPGAVLDGGCALRDGGCSEFAPTGNVALK